MFYKQDIGPELLGSPGILREERRKMNHELMSREVRGGNQISIRIILQQRLNLSQDNSAAEITSCREEYHRTRD